MVFTLSPAALNFILLLFVPIKNRQQQFPVSAVSFPVSIHLKSVHHVAISFDVRRCAEGNLTPTLPDNYAYYLHKLRMANHLYIFYWTFSLCVGTQSMDPWIRGGAAALTNC